jgi:hypothetical protein
LMFVFSKRVFTTQFFTIDKFSHTYLSSCRSCRF